MRSSAHLVDPRVVSAHRRSPDVAAAAAESDAGPRTDGGPPPGTFDCGPLYCQLMTEVCVFPRLADPTCEPRLDPMGADECRAHVDAYCGGAGERCDAGPTATLPEGAYVVLCL